MCHCISMPNNRFHTFIRCTANGTENCSELYGRMFGRYRKLFTYKQVYNLVNVHATTMCLRWEGCEGVRGGRGATWRCWGANGGAAAECARSRAVAPAPAMAAAGLSHVDFSQIKTRSIERTLLPLVKQVCFVCMLSLLFVRIPVIQILYFTLDSSESRLQRYESTVLADVGALKLTINSGFMCHLKLSGILGNMPLAIVGATSFRPYFTSYDVYC